MLFECHSVVLSSSCLRRSMTVTCVVTFICTAISGLFLILAPEEPSLDLGGGAVYSLVPSIILLFVAIVTVLLGIFGCLSVNSDSKGRMLMYAFGALILGFLTVACVSILFSFTYSSVIRHDLNSTLWSHVKDALPDSNDTIFNVQSRYHCCGVNNASDWHHSSTKWFKNNITDFPDSCYILGDDDKLYQEGCLNKLLSELQIVVDVSFAIGVVATFLQVTTACLACYGSKLIQRYEKYYVL